MFVAFLGPETVRTAVEFILARDNVAVCSLSSPYDLAPMLPGAVLLVIIARPLRDSLVGALQIRFPAAHLVALAKRAHQAPIEVLGFAEIWRLRQRVAALARSGQSAPPFPH